jgi:hypothetical protein
LAVEPLVSVHPTEEAWRKAKAFWLLFGFRRHARVLAAAGLRRSGLEHAVKEGEGARVGVELVGQLLHAMTFVRVDVSWRRSVA